MKNTVPIKYMNRGPVPVFIPCFTIYWQEISKTMQERVVDNEHEELWAGYEK